MLPARDTELIAIVDRELADVTARGGAHLACRPGCTPCCHGVFRISALDAARLRSALDMLEQTAPERAAAVTQRARTLAAVLAPHFPGDAASGLLLPEDTDENAAAWEAFADLPEADGPCPVLDPATGRCELYRGRPMTCRVFGPPVRNEDGIGVCELCYQGASEEKILAGAMSTAHRDLEAELEGELAGAGITGETVIAFALRQPGVRSSLSAEDRENTGTGAV